MKTMTKTLMAFSLLSIAAAASAQVDAGASVNAQAQVEQRDVNQQERIEQGLKSGQLNTREAGKLERGEAHIDRMESNAMRNGSVSAGEQARINAAENRESAAIYNQKHDAQVGNPTSASSERMQRNVQRDANQEQRIANGTRDGSLTTHEAAKLERGQARDDRAEARVAANGHVGAGEQARIQARENRQSGRIYRKRHNG